MQLITESTNVHRNLVDPMNVHESSADSRQCNIFVDVCVIFTFAPKKLTISKSILFFHTCFDSSGHLLLQLLYTFIPHHRSSFIYLLLFFGPINDDIRKTDLFYYSRYLHYIARDLGQYSDDSHITFYSCFTVSNDIDVT